MAFIADTFPTLNAFAAQHGTAVGNMNPALDGVASRSVVSNDEAVLITRIAGEIVHITVVGHADYGMTLTARGRSVGSGYGMNIGPVEGYYNFAALASALERFAQIHTTRVERVSVNV